MKTNTPFFALSPPDQKNRKLFFQFRNDDITLMFPVVMVLNACLWISLFYLCVAERDVLMMFNLMIRSIVLALHIIVWVLGKKYQKHMVYMVMGLYLLNLVLQVALTQTTFALSDEDAGGSRDFRNYGALDLVNYSVMLSPSVVFTGVYLVSYILGVTWITVSWRHFDDENFTDTNGLWMLFSLIAITFFTIFQKRELRNYY